MMALQMALGQETVRFSLVVWLAMAPARSAWPEAITSTRIMMMTSMTAYIM